MKRILAAIYEGLAKVFAKTPIGRLYPVKVVGAGVARAARKNKVELDGHTYFLDKSDSNRMSIRDTYEPLQTYVMKKLIEPKSHVIDLGANIGYYTMLMARSVGPQGKVYAFEPDPGNLALLKKNIGANGYKNIQVETAAVSNQNGRVKLHKEKWNDATPSLWKSEHTTSFVEVDTIRLDQFFDANPMAIQMIKMDIEGAEGKALEGMEQTIKRSPGLVIVTEFLPTVMERLGTQPLNFLTRLERHGFRLFNIDEEKRVLEPITSQGFHERYAGVWTNLLCVPEGTDLSNMPFKKES
jgi:FkbM family methyltransferase